MKVNPISTNQNYQNKQPIFKSRWLTHAWNVEKELSKKGMTCEFKNNSTVADYIRKTAQIYEKVYGIESLPLKVNFSPIPNDLVYGSFFSGDKSVTINSNLKCFDNAQALKREMETHKKAFFIPDNFSSVNPLHFFIHEFAHSAHDANLIKNGNFASLDFFRHTRIPSAIGRLIAKFKLSQYSAKNMNEFMAERISKDFNNELDNYGNFVGDKKNLDYSDIFSRKWNCRYLTPQAYIDYYTQQVWNGDIQGADKVINDLEGFLEALERKEAIRAVEIERPKEESSLKQNSFIGRLDNFFGRLFNTPKGLDRRNRLEINLEDE